MGVSDLRESYRSVWGSLGAAAVLLFWDGVMLGTDLTAMLVTPIWVLISLVRSAVFRPGWDLALVRVGIPVLTFLILRANGSVQNAIAEANARRVVAACEAYRADNGRFPRKLDELAPRYLGSVPPAKYCLDGRFMYFNSDDGSPMLVWVVTPPFLRKIYSFERRSWSYID